MTDQPAIGIEADPCPSGGLQEEIDMLRAMNQKALAWFEECQTVADRLRFLATISMSCTRVATLLKIERFLNGSAGEGMSLSDELSEELAEMNAK